MATFPGTLRRIRNARRAAAPPKASHYEEYEPAYGESLRAVRDSCGDDALSELSAWIVDRIHETGHLPEPSAVRQQARAIVANRVGSVPDGSPLRASVETDSAEAATETTRAGSTTDHDSVDAESESTEALSEAELETALEPFEPYTTAELADELDVSPGLVRSLLNRLREAGTIRKKEYGSSPTIWIREPPASTCPNCEYRFEVKFVHPVLSSVRFCPRCGTQV